MTEIIIENRPSLLYKAKLEAFEWTSNIYLENLVNILSNSLVPLNKNE